jgi:hypothetical protein
VLRSKRETLTVARCATCGRTGLLTTHGGGYWCGWCGEAREISVENVEVRPRELAPDDEIDPQTVPLQPLRIPAGWRVTYNNGLYEVDPTAETVRWWWIFKEDMLMLVHDERRRLLDLGWSPEMSIEEGCYRLSLHEEDHGGKVLHYYEGRDRAELVEEIETILEEVTNGRL